MHWDTLDYLLGHTRGVEGGESANQIVNFYIMSGIVQPLLIHFHMTDLYNITYYRYSCMHRCGWPDHIGLFCILCSSFLSFHIMGPFYLILYCQIGQKGPFFSEYFLLHGCASSLYLPFDCPPGILVQVIYRIKLPGPAILGEGKPENQNHAIIFTRGEGLQTIDMNQVLSCRTQRT